MIDLPIYEKREITCTRSYRICFNETAYSFESVMSVEIAIAYSRHRRRRPDVRG